MTIHIILCSQVCKNINKRQEQNTCIDVGY